MNKFPDDINVVELSPQISTFGARVEHAIELGGHTKARIADKLGISKQAFNYLMKHSTKPRYIEELSRFLRVYPRWLETGEGEIRLPDNYHDAPRIPLMDSQTLSMWLLDQLSSTEHLQTVSVDGDAKDFIAYLMPNDALFPPFLEGSIFIFNRGRKPKHGDYVLISVDGSDLLVRKIVEDGIEQYFKANNTLYKTLTATPAIKIIGVLHEARFRLD